MTKKTNDEISFNRLVERVCAACRLTVPEVLSPCRRMDLVKAREMVAHIAVVRMGYPIKAVAQLLGRTRSAVEHMLRQHYCEYVTDGEYKMVCDNIKTGL